MTDRPLLVTGFEAYGGRGLNPAAEIARALDGHVVEGAPVVGQTLPVSFAKIGARMGGLLRELDPQVVIALGLAPGEAGIRIERFGLDIADFEIPDNDGALLEDARIADNGPTALPATLPVRAIEQALLEIGIPARLSTTAGTYLCNACLYTLLESAQSSARATLCGFIHLPYLPAQVAELLRRRKREARTETPERAEFASMDLPVQMAAIEVALKTSLAAARAITPRAFSAGVR